MIINILEDLLLKIINNLFLKDKYNLLLTNSYIKKIVISEIQKYKLIIYLNNDYIKFYEHLNKYDYTPDIKYMDKVIAKAFIRIPYIDMNLVCAMYDLRFIFELMFKGYGRDKIKIKNICKPHFYIHFYHKLNSIITYDRKETINKIEKSHYLFTLKQKPGFSNYIKKENNFKWDSIRI